MALYNSALSVTTLFVFRVRHSLWLGFCFHARN